MTGRTLPFALVDVFAVSPLTGNPLAVVLGDATLAEPTMQRLAREFNLAETTIVVPSSRADADWQLRSFTPMGYEIFGAGHNALGAWWWLAQSGRVTLAEGINRFRQEIGTQALDLDIRAQDGRPTTITMAQLPPLAGKQPEDLGELSAALGIGDDDIGVDGIPAQVVSTGDAHLMLPVRDRGVVDRVQVDAPALSQVLRRLECEGCYVFSLDPPDVGAFAYARFLNPADGLWEDPASGGAAGPLACHLHAHGRLQTGQAVLVEQGTAIGRKSLIEARVTEAAVDVSGSAVVVGEGSLRL